MSEIKLRNFEYTIFVGFVVCFVFGGFTGLILANQAIDLTYHDTYFVVGHFHFVLSIAAAVSAALFLVNFLTAVNTVNPNSLTVAVLILVGFSAVNILFLLQHVIGIEGHPRRVFLSPEIFVGYANFANIAVPLLVTILQIFSVRHSAASISLSSVPASVSFSPLIGDVKSSTILRSTSSRLRQPRG